MYIFKKKNKKCNVRYRYMTTKFNEKGLMSGIRYTTKNLKKKKSIP